MKTFWENKKVLVTGGSGFIGSYVVESLIAKGAIVTIPTSTLANLPKIKERFKELFHKIIIIESDLFSQKAAVEACKGQEIIFHFAALDGGKKFKMENSALLLEKNTLIGLNILEAARINQVDKTLIVSSIEIYSQLKETTISEQNLIVLDEKSDGYSLAKRYIEIAAAKYQQQYNMDIVIGRLGNIYGPRDHTEKGRVIPTFITKSLTGNPIEIWGDGSIELSFLYIKDLVPALLTLCEKYHTTDPINLVGSHYISLKELALLISKLVGTNNEIRLIPTSAQNVNRKISNAKAIKLIGFKEEYPIEEGLKETIHAMKRNNKS